MKLAMFDAGVGPQVGVVKNELVYPIKFEGGMVDLISNWGKMKEVVAKEVQSSGGISLSTVKLLPPVHRPGKIFAIGLNYADHIAESKMETPEFQVWFTKAVTSVNGPNDPVLIAKNAPYVDYEVELVAVVGKSGKNIAAENAADHIFGYCVGNDVTERLWQHRTPQWSLGKSFDTHCPIGPWITTAEEVPDPHNLSLRCLVNGETRQNSNTKHLVFNIWQQIEHLSEAMTLESGDLIFTGTPGGVGAAMDPRVFLQPGDRVRCEVDTLGAIEAEMVGEV
ncbi:fumarylacetoacetate hydrolase family protein [Hirschia baltica]|uniref:5-carboxymethyl-2-hydroxymuconate Delta-isomerase n=1 Tax=Hirschia baltica (strain ATCC 49814 / DSM 5838 / IFAM 1418) TaxID=582402 RepID=C6XPJ7_HIRBI|nr:fumarylacetoacetate hydrolase family protein [Hirschia baltica]ACT60262.1 5-carboxymethyl-2-hydroxymuconate Delta-isomerase [Hirschia baltica ATCC 49814]